MTTPTTSRQWILANKPSGRPIIDGPDSIFRMVETPLPAQLDEEKGEVLLKVLYLSNDPAQRLWINPSIDARRLYTKPVEVGEVMQSYSSIAEVVQLSSSSSKTSSLQVGSLVICATGWREYVVVPAAECMPIETEGADLSPTQFSGVLGVAGVTAYYGLVDKVHAGPDDAIVISGAAGAVGSVAVQIAKNVLGCKKVIGIAGTDAKCRWVETLGADVCLNYKSKTFQDDLVEATDPFVDVFFDNTGGEVLDLMLTRLAKNGRVAACGAISEYNLDKGSLPGIKNWYDVIAMRLSVQGLVVLDLSPARWSAIVHTLLQGYREGKIQANETGQTIVPTNFEEIPKTWMRLFDGQATGKLLTKLV